MDDPHELPPQTSETKNFLPDVVHSQQIPAVGAVVADETEVIENDRNQNTKGEIPIRRDVEDTSETESISEHIPSKIEYSVTDSENLTKTHESQGLLKVEPEQEKVSKQNSLNIPYTHSSISDNPGSPNPSKQSTSWPDVHPTSDAHLSEESPVNLALSSDLSKEGNTHNDDDKSNTKSPLQSEQGTPKESPRSDEYLDSLNEESSRKSNTDDNSIENYSESSAKAVESPDKSSGSEEIIKLDIRGQGVPKFPLSAAKIIFGPPPEGSTVIDSNMEQIPVFRNLLSPFLVGAGGSLKVEELFDDGDIQYRDPSLEKSPDLSPKEQSPEELLELSPDKLSLSSDKVEQDVLIEEVTVDNDIREKEQEGVDDSSIPTQPKSMAPDETMSFSTLTTDYKTICEEYHGKLVHLEAAISQRDELIDELTVSLQRSVQDRDELRIENVHLTNEVQNLQHIVAEHSHSDHDTIKAQLSDFIKYETMVKDDSTKFFSALMSGGSSVQSSNGEKDMDREEITVNYSRSDLKSSSSSEDFQTGFENKLSTIINKFEEYLEENLRNKLRESIIQVLCNEIGKMRIDSDTEVKELESQMQQDKQAYNIETRRLRELLASVKAGSVDIDNLREELSIKHEKEMENLRTYFEKKCSDMERSYSEEVWRGRLGSGSALGSASSLEAPDAAGGDCPRRRTRSAEFPSLTVEQSQVEQALKASVRRYEQQMEEQRAEHAAQLQDLDVQHQRAVAQLHDQITQLKAHIQTTENTEANVSLYQQDIDLELEKRAELDRRLEDVRREVVQQLQDQIQVLLSDPDAEVSNWPLELVALRDKIHGDARAHPDKELSSLRDEAGEADKWKQRRNVSFDQNRQLEEVTKERDGLRVVARTLQRVVSQLVAYCASAEDELNRTVLAQLLARLHAGDDTFDEESRPSTPLSASLNASAVSRGSRHVHFAPDLNAVLADLDEEGLVTFLQQQRDVSADIKQELELSLKRLRHEAQDLLELSARMAAKRQESKMLEAPPVQISDLVNEIDAKQRHCDSCELHRKNMEESMAECLQREGLLRADLDTAMMRIAQLVTCADHAHCTDFVAEGYGLVPPLQPALSLPGRGPARQESQESGSLSLDAASPRGPAARLARDLDKALRERDDLQQQLEAANRQLRSTRQFVEEQAAEREAERDEFARQLEDLRADNARLASRLQNNARILSEMHCLRLPRCNCQAHHKHVEQLEAQTREMNQIISDLETRKASTDEELKSSEEKVLLLRDIIANLENQLEQKTVHEIEVLEQLDKMKKTIDERDSKMRVLLGELESLRSDRVEQSDVTCVRCGQEEDRYTELLEKLKEQSRWLEQSIDRRTQLLERVHEVCSAPCSEPSEDLSLRDQRNTRLEAQSPGGSPLPPPEPLGELRSLCDALAAHQRAEDAALKRVADLEMQRNQLKDVAQEVRAERDVLQARMSEQALKISSLSARLQQQRNDAEALAHTAASQLSVQLHDALAEVQRMKEELESRDKQLARMKQNLEEKEKLSEQHHSLYGNSCNPKDKVVILERELSSAQTRLAQLESLARSLEKDKEELQVALRDHQRALAEKEDQLQELLALKLDDDNQKDEKSEILEGGKTSARTLSDIVSISEFDEQDMQMRRAELKGQNVSLTGAPFDTNKTLNRTLPPELHRPNMSSLNIDYGEHYDLTNYSPRADSLPVHLTSTQNKDLLKQFKRNVNETTVFGTIDKFGDSVKHSTAQNLPDNCSMYPNRDVSESKNLTVEPKKINFSLAPSDNRTHSDEEFTSLRELGITLDIKQENFPDILTQLKHEIKKYRTQLENCKSDLKNAEEQLCEFPALKEEVEELKGLLENTMATMENDKKFYENQLDNFSSNKKLLEQRLTELTQEVNDKSKDLHLLKEDILRRENMILELAKEKRNLTNKMAELEIKIDELESKNAKLEKCESENHQMREKISELQKLEQLVSEKNQQIDSLNQHLDRLDDLQRRLTDKTEELENLKVAFEEKSNELFQMQDTVEALNHDMAKLNEENDNVNTNNKELKLILTKLEKEQENASLKLQNSESELERLNSLNNELTSKIEELKLLNDKLKDKETEIEILHEDINSYHEEISSLKEQLKMVSRSPSPKSKSGEERKSPDRRASSDKKQLVKIRKQISLLQHELDFNKKELNDKAFELAKAKLDATELRGNLSQATKQAAESEQAAASLAKEADRLRREAQQLALDKQRLQDQLDAVVARIREESNVSELKEKLRKKAERCQELESELQDLRDLVDRPQLALVASGGGGRRSPTAELERALRDQLDYSHTLDEDIMEQILSASSDEREDIPRLALNTSKSSSSIHSSSSERLNRLRAENDKLQMQVSNLEARLKDKDALITELNRTRDKLVSEWQSSKLRLEAERDNAGRLQLLLATHKDTAESLQNQDSSMIQILKKRLEAAMKSELELQQREQEHKARLAQLQRQLLQGGDSSAAAQLQHEMENNERLKGEICVLKARAEAERQRQEDLHAQLQRQAQQAQQLLLHQQEACSQLRAELADCKRLKHEASVELVRAKELAGVQRGTIADLGRRLKHLPGTDALTEIETHKSELSREIASLKACLVGANSAPSAAPELSVLREERTRLLAKVAALEADGRSQGATQDDRDDRDDAIRYLHGRCLRLESCRKALVWQKRYLQRVLAGYAALEAQLGAHAPQKPTGKARFKSVACCVVAALRMRFLVRRRREARAQAARCLLRGAPARPLTPSTQYKASLSPPSREQGSAPGGRGGAATLARRSLRHDLRLTVPASPTVGEFTRRSPFASNSPREDPFILSSPRGEVASAYLNKLELVSRCLSHALDKGRDAP